MSPSSTYFAVGAPEANTVIIYNISGTEVFRLTGNPNSKFGVALSMSDSLLAIGASGENKVYLYDYTTGSLKYTVSNNIVGTGFGEYVALQENNSRLLVGDDNVKKTSVFDIP